MVEGENKSERGEGGLRYLQEVTTMLEKFPLFPSADGGLYYKEYPSAYFSFTLKKIESICCLACTAFSWLVLD